MSTRIQKVYGKTPRDARKKAQQEFGENISIIKTRRVAANKLRPERGATYELTIAVESEMPSATPIIRPESGDETSTSAESLKEALSRVNNVLTANAYSKQTPRETPSTTPPPPQAAPEQPPQQSPRRPSRRQTDEHMIGYIGSELSEIRDVLNILMNNAKMSDTPNLPDEVLGLYRKFIKNDIDKGLAHDLAEAMEECFHDEKGRSIHQHLTGLIETIIKTSNGIQLTAKPTVVALVGPTGVGKTTTIAKLAVQYRFKKKKVVLITTDDFRIGAIEQLGTYAEILSLPMEVAHNPEELEEKIEKHSSADLILIDTPGRSQRDVPRLRLIESFLNAACPTETHLLINMTTRNADIGSMLKRFGTLGIDRLIFTKLDEATCYGPILNSGVRFKKKIAYFTTGQDVASDLEIVTPSRIATFLLRGFQKKKK